jgi:hypothetical protein
MSHENQARPMRAGSRKAMETLSEVLKLFSVGWMDGLFGLGLLIKGRLKVGRSWEGSKPNPEDFRTKTVI